MSACRLLCLLALVFALSSVSALELHVSPKGNDAWSGKKAGAEQGSADGPFATILRARDAVRTLKKNPAFKEPVTIWIHGGAYDVLQPIQLEAQDSGSGQAPITYRAATGEKATLSGSVSVTGWQKHEGSILKADVTKLGLDKLSVRQLLLDGERQPLARYPNYDANDPLYGGWAFVQPIPPGKSDGHKWKGECYLAAKDLRQWAHPEDVEFNVFAFYGWWNWIVPVKGIDAAAQKLILAKDCGYDLHPYNRFIFQNALEELDAPGEWYLDKRTQTLYFWPPDVARHSDVESSTDDAAKSRHRNVELRGHEVRIPTLDSFFRMKQGVKHVTVQGLTFHGCIGTAIVLENTEHCTIAACTVSHCGGFNGAGISVQGGHDNRAVGNDISYTGSTGIGLGGGDRITLTSANNVAENNHIHHMGVINKNAAGVGLGGVGNVVAHNLIHHGPRMGVQFGGNNLVIAYNHIHHTVLETQDGGALYTGGRDWISSRGTKIDHNFIHDTMGVGQEKDGLIHPFFTWGIYMDDNTGGVDITNNIVARSSRASLHLHNARDCIVENNIFVDGQQKQLEYDGWSKEQHYVIDHLPTMIKGWESVKDQPAWKNMRGMDIDPRNAFFPDGTMMSGNVIQRNIVLWHDASLRYVDFRHVKAAHNVSDHNLLWNGGQPIRTALSKAGKDSSDDLLAGGGVFQAADNGKTPKGWGWNHKPRPELKCLVQDGALVIDAAVSSDPKAPHSTVHGPEVTIKPGMAYRARLKLKSSEPTMPVGFAFGVYENLKGYWQSHGQSFTATSEWQEIEVVGTMPRAGEPQWKDWMRAFWLRIDLHGEKGTLSIKDLAIREAEPMNEWTSWQSEGWETHTVIADPLFEDEAKDDYRLKKDSPAWKLGFQRIPVEKIGLYEDKHRASWPVRE